jgi:hypothetical protein
MFASDPSRGRQQVEGAEIQFGPRTPMVLKNIEPKAARQRRMRQYRHR